MTSGLTSGTARRGPPDRSDDTPRGYLANVAAGAVIIGILASFTLASRLAYASALMPQDLLAIRFATSGLLLLPFALQRGAKALLRRDSLKLAFAGGIGFATPAFAGLALVPASHGGALLHGALPLFTFLIGLALGRTLSDARRTTGAVFVLLALGIIAWDSLRGTGWSAVAGDALLLIGSAIWSAFGILSARLKLEPIRVAATIAVLSAVFYLPLYLLLLGPRIAEAPLSAVLVQVAIQGVLVGTISVLAYTWAISRIGAIGAAVCTALVPAVTAFAAIPALAEYPTQPIAAALIILAAGSLLILAQRQAAPVATRDKSSARPSAW